jgi:hypothetical protein
MDSWEEGFDKWTPRTPKAAESADETGTDLDRDELLRLARELAEQRQAPVVDADSEIVQLKQSLRERAEAVAARERELTELQRRLERDRPGIRTIALRPKRADAVDGEALAARERATVERTHALDDRERAVAAEAAELEAEATRLAEREAELAEELKTVQATLAATEAERKLAAAEREQLEERDHAIHEREKTLAAERLELAAERERQEARARDLARQAAALAAVSRNDERPATDHAAEAARERAALAAVEERELALANRESKLEDSERELALRRRELEAERNSLLERERRRRRIDVADERDPVARPFAPPSFSEGLASLARSRSRR